MNVMAAIRQLHPVLLAGVVALTLIGVAMLYSAADGSFHPWAGAHLQRLGLGLALMVMACLRTPAWWYRWSYVFYAGAIFLLLLVIFFGAHQGSGAQRWLIVGGFHLQPSELMKLGLIVALARFYHDLSSQKRLTFYAFFVPLLVIAVPAVLIAIQPDLGTAILLLMIGLCVMFLAGASYFKFMILGVCSLLSLPLGWSFLHDYQKRRLLAFLDPEQDPLGAGYHAIQSKIALGSGGFWGRGFLEGPQSHLDFLPEKQTDFIFTMYAEEMGFIGVLFLFALYGMVILSGFFIAFGARAHFVRVSVLGVTSAIALYAIVNIGMVSGLLPVVGAPLPFLSYGGSSLMVLFLGVGMQMSGFIHKESRVGSGLG